EPTSEPSPEDGVQAKSGSPRWGVWEEEAEEEVEEEQSEEAEEAEEEEEEEEEEADGSDGSRASSEDLGSEAGLVRDLSQAMAGDAEHRGSESHKERARDPLE
ncbi:unnamed protein product, partial [Symbiodinium necroappetens]